MAHIEIAFEGQDESIEKGQQERPIEAYKDRVMNALQSLMVLQGNTQDSSEFLVPCTGGTFRTNFVSTAGDKKRSSPLNRGLTPRPNPGSKIGGSQKITLKFERGCKSINSR